MDACGTVSSVAVFGAEPREFLQPGTHTDKRCLGLRDFGFSILVELSYGNGWIGFSGFHYKEWEPSLYLDDLPKKQFVGYYENRLKNVEID